MYEKKVITKEGLEDVNSLIDDDRTFTAHAGINAVVENSPEDIPADVLDEILALKPFFDEGYYQNILDALVEKERKRREAVTASIVFEQHSVDLPGTAPRPDDLGAVSCVPADTLFPGLFWQSNHSEQEKGGNNHVQHGKRNH